MIIYKILNTNPNEAKRIKVKLTINSCVQYYPDSLITFIPLSPVDVSFCPKLKEILRKHPV